MSYDTDNIFARILRGELPSERVYEDDLTVVIMDIMPRADGHVLVLPKEPARTILDASPEALAACLASLQKVGRALMTAFAADGLTVQQFNEAAGGQEVFHLHFHLLPRHTGASVRRPGTMADPGVLKDHAGRIRAALAAQD